MSVGASRPMVGAEHTFGALKIWSIPLWKLRGIRVRIMSGMGGLALMRVELNSILLVILLALLQEKQLVSNYLDRQMLVFPPCAVECDTTWMRGTP
jgi:hypothetical protein